MKVRLSVSPMKSEFKCGANEGDVYFKHVANEGIVYLKCVPMKVVFILSVN